VTSQPANLDLRIPKPRRGFLLPALLVGRSGLDEAVYAVVMEAYVHGVSSKKVGDLVEPLESDKGLSKSEVSRICSDLDLGAEAFRDPDLSDTLLR